MALLIIPPDQKPALKDIISMPVEQFSELLQATKEIPTSLNIYKLSERVAANTPNISKKRVSGILSVLMSLHRHLMDDETPSDALVESVCESIEADNEMDVEFTPDTRGTFAHRLRQLLDVERFAVWAKAFQILHEQPNQIDSVRILTDIRPVFSSDPRTPPKGSVITQTLKIRYRDERKLHEMFFALDTTDIENLIEALNRSKEKAANIRLHYAVDGTTFFEAESEE
jgi:hypothetical protein